jgi:glutathione S-transferase
MKVYGTASSPFTRKVRVVAHEKALPLEFVADSPMTPDTHITAMNPLGKIPILVRPDGSTLIDSALIAEFLDTLNDSPRLIPAAGPERFDVREWDTFAAGIMDAAVLIRMESIRDANERSAKWIERQRKKIDRTLEHMDRRLSGRAYCVGNALTLADISLGCALSYLQLRFADVPWANQYAHVGRVARVLETRASFLAAPMHA